MILRKAGWKVLVVWECQTIVSKRALLKKRIKKFLTG
jgi:G:T-mismatch repair DNA endonuclease (very short patch repair protein)